MRSVGKDLKPGWQWYDNILVPDAVIQQLEQEELKEREEEARTEAEELLKSSVETSADTLGNESEVAKTDELSDLPIKSNELRIYDPHELQIMLDDMKRQPDEVKLTLKKNLQAVQKLGPYRKLAKTPEISEMANLRERFPNFSTVLDVVNRKVALAHLSEEAECLLPPILLIGPPGIGKTEFSKALAEALNTHFFDIRFSGLSGGFTLGGLDLSWASGRPGVIFKELAIGSMGNPLCLLDELDKVGNDLRYSPVGHLYTLLEPSTAKRFQDEAIPLTLDASRIQWIATANYPDRIEPALRSRFWECKIPGPTETQIHHIAQNIYISLLTRFSWGAYFSPELREDVLAVLCSATPRSIWRVLQDALGNAALAGRTAIAVNDLSLDKSEEKKCIGFY